MKWLNKRRPVMAKTVAGWKRLGTSGLMIDVVSYSHWTNHRHWRRRVFAPGYVMDNLIEFNRMQRQARKTTERTAL